MQPNPYAERLGSRDPIEALADTPWRIRALVAGWSEGRFGRSYAPGKWSAREILIHLADTELVQPVRARMALTSSDYVAEPVAGDDWLALDSGADARTSLEAYIALRAFNLALWRRLSPEERDRRFQHPKFGELSVEWIMAQMAGHDLHHLAQLHQVR
jgi:hypothetical protein